MSHADETYMRRALQIAGGGLLHASPNPMVGAVLVAPDGRIIGEGFHRRCGTPHAEPNAISSVAETNRHLIPLSTLYVTLEPCSHQGRTPACSRLIIEKQIPRVVIGSLDPFEKVNGKGVKMLRNAGVEVTVGVLEKECLALNKRFITCHRCHRPWVTLKWAMTADGYIDASPRLESHQLKISTSLTSVAVHRLRAVHDAILVGSQTVTADNPSLNLRLFAGDNPLRIVLGGASLDLSAAILSQEDTLLFTTAAVDSVNANTVNISPRDLPAVLSELYNRGISSVLVEGGTAVINSFIDSNLWDAIRVEISPKTIPTDTLGIKAPRFPGDAVITSRTIIEGNLILSLEPRRPVEILPK